MNATRIFRIILGVLLIAVFAWYMKAHNDNWVHSDEARELAAEREAFIRENFAYLLNPAESSENAETPSEEVAEPEETEEPIATPEPTIDPDSPAGRALAQGLPVPPEIDINEWQFMLVNANNPLDPQDYAPEEMAYLNMTVSETDIQYSYNQYRCPVDARIAEALLDFAKGCADAGLPVYLSSGYRSYADQRYLFDRKVGQGYTEDIARTIVAYPGTSEHQTGLVCDITDFYRETKDSSLENTDTYKWLCEHCTEYGFVVRYPADKSGSADSITGVIYEPWHFRYVGVEAAKYMTENNLCLEEFVELYK